MNAVAEAVEKQLPAWVNGMKKAEDRFVEQASEHNLVTWSKEASFARQAIQKNPKLQESTEQSVIDAIVNIAGVGLSLSPALKEAYLVPRTRKVKSGNQDMWITEAYLDISYRGLCKLATNSGTVQWAQADIVRDGEKFVLRGLDKMPLHEREPFAKDKGDIVGAFCTVKLANGDYLTEVMDMIELDQIRDTSTSYQMAIKYKNTNSVWHQWPLAMMRKTVIRRASKLWPASGMERFHKAVDVLNQFDGVDEYNSEPRLVQRYTDDQKNAFDKAVANDDSEAIWHMARSLPVSIWTDLVGSGEKGKVTALRNQVRELEKRGLVGFQSTAQQLHEFHAQGDDMGAIQILEEYEHQRTTLNEQIDALPTEVIEWCDGLPA